MPPLLVLVPGPLLGPAVWQPVERVLAAAGTSTLVCPVPTPVRTGSDVLDALLGALPADRDTALVVHSNAGAYVPSLVTGRRVVAAVFVDAILPPSNGRVALAPGAFLERLRAKADPDGLLPPWTRWWDEADVAPLFPDGRTRARIESGQRRLPMSYFEDSLPAPTGWDDRPMAYLAFGDAYAEERDDAGGRGWPVATLAGGHLHMLRDPEQVAGELTALLTRLGVDLLSGE